MKRQLIHYLEYSLHLKKYSKDGEKMKKIFLISCVFSVFSFTPSIQANEIDNELSMLKKQMMILQNKIAALEHRLEQLNTAENKVTVKAKSEQDEVAKAFVQTKVAGQALAEPATKDIKLYATLRPTFGYIEESDEKLWDVRDALSHAGFKSTYAFAENWQAILHGEWGIDLSNNGDFGKARQVYVALDSPIGRVGIGKQRPVQYLFIAEYIDIFNHGASPFAYDPESIFFVDNLVTYQIKQGDFTWMAVSQFNGESGDNNSDLFNVGGSYDHNNLHLAATYLTESIAFQNEELGTDETYGGSFAYTLSNGLYLALGYQDKTYERNGLSDREGHTFDASFAYPLSSHYKIKWGYSDFEDGVSNATSNSFNGVNMTFEWLPAPQLRFHLEYLSRDFDERENFDSISIGFRYDYSQVWKL